MVVEDLGETESATEAETKMKQLHIFDVETSQQFIFTVAGDRVLKIENMRKHSTASRHALSGRGGRNLTLPYLDLADLAKH